MRKSARPGGLRVPLLVALGLLTLAACGSEPASTDLEPGSGAPSAASIPSIQITPSDGSSFVRLDQPVTVSVQSGVVETVRLHTDADPAPLPGELSADRTTWTSTSGLDAKARYVVEATARGDGGTATARAAFVSMPVANRLTTTVSPGDGDTVGVAMPITLTFSAPVALDKQVALLKHVVVQTTPPVLGAWHWFTQREVHWRPRDMWPAGTRVTVDARLRGADAGGGVWAVGNWSSTFSVGEKHVSIIDAAAHSMQVFQSDKLIHTYPVSTGRDRQFPTISGTMYVPYKLQRTRMVSTSIGIPVNSPLGYDEQVYWNTAFSTDGYYIHSAPWSVGAQGTTNVSHGCVNLSPARAAEFFQFTQVGDAVIVKNTILQAGADDGEGDWQIPFAQYANSGTATVTPAAGHTNAGGL